MSRETYRNVRKQRFTQVSNLMLNDNTLTLQEKGLLAIFLSNAETFDIHMKEIITRSKNGRDAHYKVINSLIEHGYFARVEIMDKETRTFKEMIYIFSDEKEDVAEELEKYKDNKYAFINRSRRKAKVAENPVESTLTENQETVEKPLPENQNTEDKSPETQYNNNTKGNNTNLNNTKDINNIYLSKKTEILNLNVDDQLKLVLDKQIDKLIEFNINLEILELHYASVSDLFGINEYSYVVNCFLDKMTVKPSSLSSVLNDWLKRNRKKLNEFAEIKKGTVREEIVPTWIKSETKKEEEDAETIERRAKLQARLKEKYKKNKA